MNCIRKFLLRATLVLMFVGALLETTAQTYRYNYFVVNKRGEVAMFYGVDQTAGDPPQIPDIIKTPLLPSTAFHYYNMDDFTTDNGGWSSTEGVLYWKYADGSQWSTTSNNDQTQWGNKAPYGKFTRVTQSEMTVLPATNFTNILVFYDDASIQTVNGITVDLNGGVQYTIKCQQNGTGNASYYYSDGTTLLANESPTDEQKQTGAYLWTFHGNDPYDIQLHNVAVDALGIPKQLASTEDDHSRLDSQKGTFSFQEATNVGKTSSTAYLYHSFVLLQGQSGKFELAYTTQRGAGKYGNGNSNYQNIAIQFLSFNNANQPMIRGNWALGISPYSTGTSWTHLHNTVQMELTPTVDYTFTFHLINLGGQEVLRATQNVSTFVVPLEMTSSMVTTYRMYAGSAVSESDGTYTLTAGATALSEWPDATANPDIYIFYDAGAGYDLAGTTTAYNVTVGGSYVYAVGGSAVALESSSLYADQPLCQWYLDAGGDPYQLRLKNKDNNLYLTATTTGASLASVGTTFFLNVEGRLVELGGSPTDVSTAYNTLSDDGGTGLTLVASPADAGSAVVIAEYEETADERAVVPNPVITLSDDKATATITLGTPVRTGDRIFYTLDGTDPNTSSTQYTSGPIPIGSGVVKVKAIAFNAEGTIWSPIATMSIMEYEPQYIAIHKQNVGYLRINSDNISLSNDGTFRYDNAFDNNGASVWVLTQEGYLKNQYYYLNVAGTQPYLSVDPITSWDLTEIDDNGKMSIMYDGHYLASSGGIKLVDDAALAYHACPITITEKSWSGPTASDVTVQSPQQITYLRHYYTQKMDYTFIDDGGTTRSGTDKNRRVYATLYHADADNTDWGIANGIIYNKKASGDVVIAGESYQVTSSDPIANGNHAAETKTIKITVKQKVFVPDDAKNYLLYSIKGGDSDRYIYDDGIAEGGTVKPDGIGGTGTNSVLTDPDVAPNQQISWKIVVDEKGFYSFRNVSTGRYLYYDNTSDGTHYFGLLKVGATAIPAGAAGNSYKFKLFKTTDGDYGGCYNIVPYVRQDVVYSSSGLAAGLYATLNNANYKSPTPKVVSLYLSGNSTWCIYAYEAEYRLRSSSDVTISGPSVISATGNHTYLPSDGWYGKFIKESPKSGNAQRGLVISGTYNTSEVSYLWEVSGLAPYINIVDGTNTDGTWKKTTVGSSGLVINVTSLPLGVVSGTVQLQWKAGTDPNTKYSGKKTFMVTILGSGNVVFTDISALSEITSANGAYRFSDGANLAYSETNKPAVATFSGILEGNGKTISGLTQPLFTTLSNGVVRNLNFSGVSIDAEGPVGAIAGTANGGSRIYNVGILDGSLSSSGGYCGGLVGLLDGGARVINCFSYADITGGTDVGGLVGYNNYASTSSDLRTMVMNCMYYGNITGGTTVSPIYGGERIHSDYKSDADAGINNFNYYRFNSTINGTTTDYNCALAAEDRFLERFEFYRQMLNSNRELACWYVTNSTADARSVMAKWVIETADRTNANPKPYPVLKSQANYPSIINPDAAHAEAIDAQNEHRNEGRKLTDMGTNGMLRVTITMGSGGAQFAAPTGASITTPSLNLPITDKDAARYNFNYGKIQLPYYNDIGTGNYTRGRVVTGWKIISVTGGTAGTFTTGDDATFDEQGNVSSTPYNFADRKCTNKDLYSVSRRVFSQGAYYDVPDGVTAISIEPYWAKATYLSDPNYDKTYKNDYSVAKDFAAPGDRYTNGDDYPSPGSGQKVYTSMGNAINNLDRKASHSVYDYAVVLVGNYHCYLGKSSIKNDDKPFTIMSIDNDRDNEPDYSLIYQHTNRVDISPIRFDFINWIGIGMAQKAYGSQRMPNIGIFWPNGWFEVTNTCIAQFMQIEYSRSGNRTVPFILQGGVVEQIVSAQHVGKGQTNYLHLGGNVWFKMFNNGTHADNKDFTPHIPISVTGGDYDLFYLSGMFLPSATANADHAECYISGGRFGEVAGSGQEQINGNVTWQIDRADIAHFYGGGINAAKPITGNINVDIRNSHVDVYCGGPKFGNMDEGKTVVTNASGCTFGTYFGAGYGGTSYNRFRTQNVTNKQNYDYNAWRTSDYGRNYNASRGGIATNFEYELFPFSGFGDNNNVGRFYINYASLSLAVTHDVRSTLNGCTVTGNFYGGGSLGKVEGDVTSILTNCTVLGNAFGAGFSATVPTVDVMPQANYVVSPNYNGEIGAYTIGVPPAAVTYTWSSKGSTSAPFTEDEEGYWIYTDENLRDLGTVQGDVSITLDGTTVGSTVVDNGTTRLVQNTGNVFGGGEMSNVNRTAQSTKGNTQVNIHTGSRVMGSVYGAGKGLEDDEEAAIVKGNATVTLTGGKVESSVYGGGQLSSVGTFELYTEKVYDESDPTVLLHDIGDVKTAMAAGTGTTTVTISGGIVGAPEVEMPHPTSTDDSGYVFTGGRGLADSISNHRANLLAVVGNTVLNISGGLIVASAYGGSENGQVLGNTSVTMSGGQIGVGLGKHEAYSEALWTEAKTAVTNAQTNPSQYGAINTVAAKMPECAQWEYGPANATKPTYYVHDIYAKYVKTGENTYVEFNQADYDNGLYGVHPEFYYKIGDEYVSSRGGSVIATDGHTFFGSLFGGGSGYYPIAPGVWRRTAGIVRGNTSVTITGGHILTSIYGGNELTDVLGSCTVSMTGGTLGVPRTQEATAAHPVTCYIYGAGKGDERTFFNTWTNVASTTVTIGGTAVIYGSVFGGGEDGHVLGDISVTVGETGAANQPWIGTWGTSYVDGNIFGGGRGFGGKALTAGSVGGNISVDIKGGTMLGSVYGGGRLASVGTFFTNPEHEDYGMFQHSDVNGDGEDNDHGFIKVDISGGTIGNSFEYVGNPSPEIKSATMPGTEFDANNLLQHTKGGNVFGGCMGRIKDNLGSTSPIWPNLAKAMKTRVTITGGTIKSSVYGGGEIGFVRDSCTVVIRGGTIGTSVPASQLSNNADYNNADHYHFGSVFGGGYGAEDYTESDTWLDFSHSHVLRDNNIPKKIPAVALAGRVFGNAYVRIEGGQVLENVFGGGDLAGLGTGEHSPSDSVLVRYTPGTGFAYVTMTGGVIGPLDGTGFNAYVYGGGRGVGNDPDENYKKYCNLRQASLILSGGTIYGSVFGGGADCHVLENVYLLVGGNAVLGTNATTSFDGNIFGGGRNYQHTNTTAGRVGGNVYVLVVGGTVKGNIYGGGRMGQVGVDVDGNMQDDTEDKQYGHIHVEFFGGTVGLTPSTSYSGNIYGGGMGRSVAESAPALSADNKALLGRAKQTHVHLEPWSTASTINSQLINYIQQTYFSIPENLQSPTLPPMATGSVYGGGKNAQLGSTEVKDPRTEVIIAGGTVGADVYGGGEGCYNTDPSDLTSGRVDGNTLVNVYGGQVLGDVYGGSRAAFIEGSTLVNIGKEEQIGDATLGPTLGTGSHDPANANTFSSGRVFGANNLAGYPTQSTMVHIYSTKHSEASANQYPEPDTDGDHEVSSDELKAAAALATQRYAIAAVYGGGNQAPHTPTEAENADYEEVTSTVYIHDCKDNTVCDVYGGGNAADTRNNRVTIDGGRIYRVFGGGNGYGAGNPGANVLGTATTLVHAGIINNIFGGSNQRGTIGNVVLSIDNETNSPCLQYADDAFGGGNEAAGGGGTITLGCGTHFGTFYGGSRNANITGDVHLIINGGLYDYVFGGSKGSAERAANISGDVTVDMHGGHVGSLFGGCDVNGNIGGKISVNVEMDPTITCDGGPYVEYVYGGGRDASYAPTYAIPEGATERVSPEVKIIKGRVERDVFGGGLGATATVSNSGTCVWILGNGTVIGGNVYGGGSAAAVNGNTKVIVK